ncbi:trmA [Symbiodinium microadriaticum]|nr:trmA [Symbiodinium microadriaticum]
MMASIGLVAQHFVKFPFFENAPAGFSIMDKGEGVLGFFGIFLACAPLELWWRENPEREPGNYGDPFAVNMYTEEMRMKIVEQLQMIGADCHRVKNERAVAFDKAPVHAKL